MIQVFALIAALQGTPAPATSPDPDTTGALLTNAGVLRAAGKVDSVFVARTLDSTTVAPADWASYLMARLGVKPIPETGLRITLDPRALRIRGTIGQLPREAQGALAGFIAMFDPSTPLEASVILDRPQPDAVRFHLDSARLGGIPVPEPILGPGLEVVGRQYPVLMNGGRDLFVAIPAGATVRYAPSGIVLLAPPSPPTPPKPRRPAARSRP
ncbi:MAG TPA: hypothetical protein VFI13_00755 [Gemmatimonadales bacterium]|nr:hypothetical protein [Gemmatimonadales bacterium]